LEKNLSLNTLALALSAERFRIPMLQSCNQGLAAYAIGHQGRSATLRNKLFSKIKESRCIIDYVLRETYEVPELSQGQYGMVFRLSNWDVKGTTATKQFAPLTLEISAATLDLAYRGAMIFSRPQGEERSRWNLLMAKSFRPLGGYTPLLTQSFSFSFGGKLSARFSTIGTLEQLGTALEKLRKAEISREALRQFLADAVATVQAILNGKPMERAITMIAIAIDAIKAIGASDLSRLKIATTELVREVQKTFGAADVIDSATNALFCDSHQVLPAKLIDDAMWRANARPLMRDLDIEPESTEPVLFPEFDPSPLNPESRWPAH
jgi:hypothetical protein